VSDTSPSLSKHWRAIVFAFPSLLSAAISADSIPTLDTVTVHAESRVRRETFSPAVEEKITGLTDDINKVLVLKPGVDRIPEAGSSLLINGGSPYDNLFYVYDVPMFAPSHFSNHSYADRSGTMIASLNRVMLANDNIAGRFAGASNGVIEFRPEIYRPADPKLIKRPELVVDFGTLDLDLQLSFPHENDALYQFACSNAWAYNIRWYNMSSRLGTTTEQASLGKGQPGQYGDLVFTGHNAFSHSEMQSLVWLAYDLYSGLALNASDFVPWGCGSARIENSANSLWKSMAIGGSRQQYFEGKRFGPAIPLKSVVRNAAAAVVELRQWRNDVHSVNFTMRAEGLDWNGACALQDSAGTLLRNESGDEGTMTISGSLRSVRRPVSAGFDILAGGVAPGGPVLLDPGAWVEAAWAKISLGANAGSISSQPDIRGLPDPRYRASAIRTYSGSILARSAPFPWISLYARGYVHWKDDCPKMSDTASHLFWDPNAATPLLSRGIESELKLAPCAWMNLEIVQNLGRSERLYGNIPKTYEWDLPWSTKGVLKILAFKGNMDFFLIGMFSEGLPYSKIAMAGDDPVYTGWNRRAIPYKRIDFQWQFRQPVNGHRYFSRYDVYFNIMNIFDWGNAREYYWDEQLKQHAILLEPFLLFFGARLGFRL
jgi:hypothetical protein